MTKQWFDTNTFRLTTNWFECVDIGLTNGTNRITLRATDLAGNVATNVYTYLLSYAGDTNAPVLTLYWPQNGTQISGDSFTLRGKLDDATASVTAQIVDASNVTNLANGLLERDGLLWVADLPLGAGTNTLTLTMTDAAGNMRATNFSVVKSTVLLTIDDLSGVDVNQPKITVTGTINVSDHTVWVNGVKATLNGDGTWTAVDVPVNEGGTAVVQARAIPNTDNGGNGSGGSGGNSANMENPGNPTSPNGKTVEGAPDKPPEIVVTHYHKNWEFAAVRLLGTPVTDHNTINIQWNLNQPGYWTWDTCYGDAADDDYYYVWADGYWGANGIGTQTGNFDRGPQGEVCGVKTPLEPTPYTAPGWPGEHCQDGAGRVIDDPYLAESEEVKRSAQTLYQLRTGGKKGSKRKNLFMLTASASSIYNMFYPEIDSFADSGQIHPSKIRIPGASWLDDNDVAYAIFPDGTSLDITPRAEFRYYAFDISAAKYKSYFTVKVDMPDPEGCNISVGTDVGHAWWSFGTEAPSGGINMFMGNQLSQFIGVETGYYPADHIDFFVLIGSFPGFLELNDSGHDVDATKTYEIGFPDLISGLQFTKGLNDSPGTWNEALPIV